MIKKAISFVTQRYAEFQLDDMFDIADDTFLQQGNVLRDEIEGETQVYLKIYAQFTTNLVKQLQATNPELSAFIDENQNNPKAKVYIRDIVRAYNNLHYSVRLSGMQQGHQEVGVVTKQLLILYTLLEKAARAAKQGGQPSMGVPRTLPTRKGSARTRVGVRAVPIANIDAVIEDIRQLYITSKALDEATPDLVQRLTKVSRMVPAINLLEEAVNDYIEKGQLHHSWEKKKTIDVITGKAVQKLEFEVKANNQAKGKITKLLGEQRSNVLENVFKNTVLRKMMTSSNQAEAFTKIEGSTPLEDEIVKQISQVAVGKKPKKYNINTKKKKPAKRGKRKPLKGARGAKAAARKAKELKLKPLPQARKESGKEDRQQEILKLQKVINKRLPAEVRRNMGRPALINRSGRFSNSVELLRMQENASGALSGDYTYQLSPYETFENNGVRRWPAGYNPKDLITKSIRNLAEQYTTQKFSYLRRT